MRELPRLYIASPLFSEAERTFNKSLKTALSHVFSVYLPQEDGNLLVDLVSGGMNTETAMQRIFREDVDALNKSEVILVVMDGRAMDEGACFELGLAFEKGKKCIGLQTDPRRLLPEGNNPMIMGALSKVFQSIDEIQAWASGVFSQEAI